jgi:hypothetical protein
MSLQDDPGPVGEVCEETLSQRVAYGLFEEVADVIDIGLSILVEESGASQRDSESVWSHWSGNPCQDGLSPRRGSRCGPCGPCGPAFPPSDIHLTSLPHILLLLL